MVNKNIFYNKIRKRFFYLLPFIIISLILGCSEQPKNYLGYIESQPYYLSSTVSGELIKLNVSKGDEVKKDQPLFEINTSILDTQIQAAKNELLASNYRLKDLLSGVREPKKQALIAQINAAKAQLDYSELTYQRTKKLWEQKIIQKENYDLAKQNLTKAQSQLQQAKNNLIDATSPARPDQIEASKAEVERAKAQLASALQQKKQASITAPIDGTVVDTYYQIGEQVPALHPVISLQKSNELKVIFFVPQAEVTSLKLGDHVNISINNTQYHTTGVVTFISPVSEFTPPVIYSREASSKIIFRIEAKIIQKDISYWHVGQPVSVSKGNTN